jgi:phycobilisome linker polypeptide/EF hand domain-containing protein
LGVDLALLSFEYVEQLARSEEIMRATVLLTAFVLAPALSFAQQPCTSDADSTVDAIYRQVLERPAAGEGNARAEQLRNGQTSVREIVRDLARSPEHLQRFLPANDRNQAVSNMYRHLLGRAPDPGGLNSHVQGRESLAALVDTFINSPEYQQKYGDDTVPGGNRRYCRGGSGPASYNNNNNGRIRFQNLDRNGNRIIEREEWNGNRQSFDNQDWNGDGVLSGEEVQPGAQRGRRGAGAEISNRDDRFETLDTNGNDRIERGEWQGSLDAFAWLDRNNDNVLSRAEVVGEGSGRFDSFSNIDTNRDGTIRPDEWRWSRRIFDQYDTDSDGFLTRREFAMGGGAPAAAR